MNISRTLILWATLAFTPQYVWGKASCGQCKDILDLASNNDSCNESKCLSKARSNGVSLDETDCRRLCNQKRKGLNSLNCCREKGFCGLRKASCDQCIEAMTVASSKDRQSCIVKKCRNAANNRFPEPVWMKDYSNQKNRCEAMCADVTDYNLSPEAVCRRRKFCGLQTDYNIVIEGNIGSDRSIGGGESSYQIEVEMPANYGLRNRYYGTRSPRNYEESCDSDEEPNDCKTDCEVCKSVLRDSNPKNNRQLSCRAEKCIDAVKALDASSVKDTLKENGFRMCDTMCVYKNANGCNNEEVCTSLKFCSDSKSTCKITR